MRARVRDSSLGLIFDVKLDPAGYNIAYTAEEVPPHNDNAQYTNPPSGQVLAMLINDATGGESVVVDTWNVVEQLAAIDPTMLDVPEPTDYGWPEESEYEVRIKAGGNETSIWYRNDPLKVVGWKGDLFPYRFNIKSILPIMSNRIHLAPSSWATFESDGFVVVSFVPQIAVADLDAEELPSYHRNIDMDEVILSHANDEPGGRRPGGFTFTPESFRQGLNEVLGMDVAYIQRKSAELRDRFSWNRCVQRTLAAYDELA